MKDRPPSALLPFRAPVPEAIATAEIEIVCDGRTYTVVIDRYRTSDCRWLEEAAHADNLHPEESFTIRFRRVGVAVSRPTASWARP